MEIEQYKETQVIKSQSFKRKSETWKKIHCRWSYAPLKVDLKFVAKDIYRI